MKAFISSTSQDLGDYRQAAREVCNRLAIVPIVMEEFESMGVGATAGSKHKLDDADVYVGIVANRYGYIEEGYDKSVTEIEFDHAGVRGLERLCFVADAAAQLPQYPEDEDKLTAFKARMGNLIRSTFRDPWEFRYKLYDSLLKWLFRQRGVGPLARHVFDPLFTDYARFGGRSDILNRIKAFIDASEAGYLVITAPAGYGKTALAVKLIESHRDITAYHFFTTLYRSEAGAELLSEPFFLKNVVEQMRLWQSFPDPWETPTTLSGWVAAYQKLLATPLAEKRLLVIDGLDEVQTWSLHPYLNAVPPTNLKIVVTVRDDGKDWAAEYGFPKAYTWHHPLDGLTPTDVRDVLRLAGPVAAAFADDATLLAKVVAVTSPQNTVAGADPLYVNCLADAIESHSVSAANIDAQPPKLEEYLQRWWQTIVAQAGKDSATLVLLGTLAAALGPIRREDLIAIHPSLKPSWTDDPIATALGSVRRTVAGTDATGYAFTHPRFRDYLRHYPEVQDYEAKLFGYCKSWQQHHGHYALTYAIQYLAAAGAHDELFTTVLDAGFQAAQQRVLGSVHPTIRDLVRAITIAGDTGAFLRLLRCVVSYRQLAQTEGLAQAVFKDVAQRHFGAAGRMVATYGFGGHTSSAWFLVLRCYLVWEVTRAGDHNAALSLVDAFARQFGLRAHGVSLHTSDLCDVLIASAIGRDPTLAAEIGLAPEWAPALLARLTLPPLDTATLASRLHDLGERIQLLEPGLGENPELPEIIDEVRAGAYTLRLRDALVEVSHDVRGRALLERALEAVQKNPYPRYRDNLLVALGIAALAVPDAAWVAARMQAILETGIEQEGVTFTFDLPAQLVAEADRRGLPAAKLAGYLQTAAASYDRWGMRLRSTSAQAAADFAQARTDQAFAALTQAASFDQGFAGYMAMHLLTLASRWCEFADPARVATCGLIVQSRSHAKRVRDPHFATERQVLVDHFEHWLAEPLPEWPEVSAVIRTTPGSDTCRAYTDLVSARWAAAGHWQDWQYLILSTLTDATALDFVLARLAARAMREHHDGVREFPDAALAEAITLCGKYLTTDRPYGFDTPAYV
jgi:uncharacterized protein DUF4062